MSLPATFMTVVKNKTVTIDNKNTLPMIQLAPSTNRCALRASLHDKNAIIAS